MSRASRPTAHSQIFVCDALSELSSATDVPMPPSVECRLFLYKRGPLLSALVLHAS